MNEADLSVLPRTFINDQLEEEKDYWLKKLSGDTVVTGLPLDFNRPAAFGGRKASCALELEPETSERLLEVCRGKETLVFAVLVTALKICLFKYTGAEDVIVGTGIHEQHGETASLNKLLALRTQVTGDTTARQLLEEVRRTLSEAYANQRFPFERLLELLNVEAADNRAPLFNVVAILENINSRANVEQALNDVTLVFAITDGRLSGAVEYNPDLFESAGIELFARHYRTILRAVLDAPESKIAEMRLLSPAKERELVLDFNATERSYPKDKTVHALVSEQAARTPASVAVSCAGRRLTYLELDERADALARYLRANGGGRGVRVGIYLEHSVETLVALLGVLKSGAAYVPFEPAHPVSRLSFMLTDAAIPLVLTQERLSERVTATGIKTICLDSDWDKIAEAVDSSLPSDEATADDLAYVMYTSGSTGEPKGVEIRHASLVNYVWWAREAYGFTEQTAVPLYSSLAFDLTVTSIYTPLVAGGTVVVYRQEGRESPLTDVLRDNAVEILKLTPSHLALIKEQDNSQSRIKRLIVGGEAFDTALAARVHESFARRVDIFNEYGPTEATVGCMIYRFDPDTDQRAFVPIGKPAANAQIYILDKELSPVAENIVGELYISGDGLAQGYLNRAELTAERFIENPFLPGRKMYRSGDVARWLHVGEIEFVGRADDQVKFHGYRVELNALRCALNRHPQVKDSVVLVTQDHSGHDVMIAYYVSRQEVEMGELRAFLAESIIEEMLPNVFVHLKRLPLTLNGKVNHRALPTLEEARKRLKRTFVAPQTPTEQAVAKIWAQVLGVEQVGLHDNFFELGGHSLLATLIISRVREAFQVDLPLRSLFKVPTVAGIVEHIEAIRWAAEGMQNAGTAAVAAGETYEEGLL
ncbi:MAG TPA: amino acid adenylation domain-containing protein [Pyrinomonadaceae bacterium]|jgi:amino acid adenylation domain-containing protein|nr:amino acid adenylation domain-containing protein [Pyrinomonadaceae bacterium]